MLCDKSACINKVCNLRTNIYLLLSHFYFFICKNTDLVPIGTTPFWPGPPTHPMGTLAHMFHGLSTLPPGLWEFWSIQTEIFTECA